MKPTKSKWTALGILPLAMAIDVPIFRHSRSLSVREMVQIATDAYICGCPLITFATARRQQTHVAEADAEHAPMGRLIKMRNDPGVDNHCCAVPHADDHLSSLLEFLANRYIKERSMTCN